MLHLPAHPVRGAGNAHEHLVAHAELLVNRAPLVEPVVLARDDKSRRPDPGGELGRPAEARRHAIAHHALFRAPGRADAIPRHDRLPHPVADAGLDLAAAAHVGVPALLLEIRSGLEVHRIARLDAIGYLQAGHGGRRGVEHSALYLFGVPGGIAPGARAAGGEADDAHTLH